VCAERRTGSDVAAPESAVARGPPRLPAVPQPRSPQRWDEDLPLRPGEADAGQLFATAHQGGGAGRLPIVGAGVGWLAGVLLGLVLLRGRPAATPPPPTTTATAPAA